MIFIYTSHKCRHQGGHLALNIDKFAGYIIYRTKYGAGCLNRTDSDFSTAYKTVAIPLCESGVILFMIYYNKTFNIGQVNQRIIIVV